MHKLLTELIAYEGFKELVGCDKIHIMKLYTLTNYLLHKKIPFDTSYTPGTTRDGPTISLTVYFSPTISLTVTITLDEGSAVFTPVG